MRIDVRGSRELQAVIFALRLVDSTFRKVYRREVKRIAEPEFRKALAQHASTRLENRVLVNTAVVRASDQNIRMMSASKGRKLSGGLNPKTDYAAVEFGANRDNKTTYQRTNRSGGGKHKVTRAASRQFRARNRDGYTFYPTVRKFIPRMASLAAQTLVRTLGNATEGKQQ